MIDKAWPVLLLSMIGVCLRAAEAPRVEVHTFFTNTTVRFDVAGQDGMRFFYQASADLNHWAWTGFSNPGNNNCVFHVPSHPAPTFVRAIGVAAGTNDYYAVLPVNAGTNEVVVFNGPRKAEFIVESSTDGNTWTETGRSVTSETWPPGIGRLEVLRSLTKQVRLRFAAHEDALNIAEVVFRDFIDGSSDRAYYLSLTGHDPDQRFLDRFTGRNPPVQAASAFSPGSGTLLKIDWIRSVTQFQAEADGEWYVGPLAAAGWRLTLELRNGIWVVIDRKTLWVS